MQHKIIVAVFIVIVVLVGLAPGLPHAPSLAQDSTPIPTFPPLPTPDSVVRQVVSLPFGESFDVRRNWNPQGAWRFAADNAFSGAGWYLEGSQRKTVSMLEYTGLIDLSGTLSVQLLYRQKGYLPTTDLIALEISLDGGETWFMIDQQIGADSDDWEERIIDLTDYRGQVIALRFRVTTGVQYASDVPEEYWIDSLTIQYYIPPPETVFVPVDTGPRTLMGLHLVVGARKEPVLELAERLNAVGWPLGTLKGTSGTEDILREVAAISPNTVIVYRSLLTPQGMRDCPDIASDPAAAAQTWMAGQEQFWQDVPADYYEIINECQAPMDWMVEFSIEAMRIANQRGRCLLLFSFGPGNPEIDEFAQLVSVYEYALENPCQPGRYHGIALHAYGVDTTTLVSESGIYLGLRHRLFYERILNSLPDAIQIPVYLTEVGSGDGHTPFSCEDTRRDVMQYTQQLEYDPYIRGFHLWNFGPSRPGGVDITPCLPIIGDALINYYAQK
jgi:hypothetical protein